ncbi:MAG: arylsulfatase [Chloroflexi bacterium]|nr:arylsulfatase [Chloroflexota bacterium]|tara:strand:+ start:1426 stop:2775 length:1350 start_codon:yes stop_codon:yes gene_type:complete
MEKHKPNILLILADNLGWGELGCYGGGILRGAPTPNIDNLASEGIQFLNFNVESDCVPTRAALMTGRQAIRTGAYQSLPAGLPQGLTRWEIVLPELLSEAGYSTGHFGKWHLGDSEGRLPNDRGFDEWYGLPRTMNESLFTTGTNYEPELVPIPMIYEGTKGSNSQPLKELNLDTRRTLDRECVDKTIEFIRKNANENVPFFAYVPLTQLHFPSLSHPDFIGFTGHGEMADSLAEMDHNVGLLLNALSEVSISDNTLVIFGSDNGPEFRDPWRGTAGYWRSTYHTAMEGSLRAPFIMNWPNVFSGNRVTNEIFHITDIFPTLLSIIGIEPPNDRFIDGLDQKDFLYGEKNTSNREGFVFFIKDEIRAIKWRHWKMHLIWEPEVNDGAIKLEAPYVFNLIQDPKEETNVASIEANWVRGILLKMVHEFRKSLKEFPPVPPGTPDPYSPSI